MKRILLFVICTVGFRLPAIAAEWNIEPVGPGTNPALAVGEDGVVHIAWAIERPGESVYYARRESDGWETEVAVSGYFDDALDLGLDGDGRVHIAFHDHNAESAAHLFATSTGWDITYVFHPGHDGWNPSIAVAPDARVDLASFDPDDGIEFAVIRGSNVDVEVVGTGPLDLTFGTSLALDDDTTPHLCYHYGDDSPPPDGKGSLYYSVRTSGGWAATVIDSGGDVGKYPSLALDRLGVPHVAYLKRETSSTATLRYAFRDEGSWVIEDVLLLDALGDDLSGAHHTVSLAVDADGRPHIASSDTASVFYAVRTDYGWVVEPVVVQTSSNHEFGRLASLALGPDGEPHIAFTERSLAGGSSVGTVYHAFVTPQSTHAPRRPSGRVRPSFSSKLLIAGDPELSE